MLQLLPVYLVPLSCQKEDMATMVQQKEEDQEDREDRRDLEADVKL
jgi:hypothetical protein